MSYSRKFLLQPLPDADVVDIDGSTSLTWIPSKTYICYGGLGQMVQAASGSLAQTKQVGLKKGTTDYLTVTVPSSAAARTDVAAALETSAPFKIGAGESWVIYTKNAETTKNGTVIPKLWVSEVDG